MEQVTRWIQKKNSGVFIDKVPCNQLASKMDKSHFNVIYFGAGAAGDKIYEGFAETAKEKSFDFWHAEGDCAKEYGTTAPGVSIVRTTGGPSPLAWPGLVKAESDEKAKAEMTPEQKALADHDVASTLEAWTEF